MKSCSDRNLDQKIAIVISDMNDWFATGTFTSCGVSIFPILWEDGTEQIECKHGEVDIDSKNTLLYISKWYDGEISRRIVTVNSKGDYLTSRKFTKNETGIYEEVELNYIQNVIKLTNRGCK